jgi:hypothetical protein
MKKLILLSSMVILSGCASFADLKEAYLMKYDSNEYLQIANIRTDAYYAKQTCSDYEESKRQANNIARKTLTFKNYAEHLPNNSKVVSASVNLDGIAQGLKDQYQKNDKVSTVFCKIKFESIETSAETMQKTIGVKPK